MRELSLHILDIAMNSIEAEATRVIIVVEELESENLFRIRLRDNGKGMTKDMQEKVTDPFVTTRKTRSVGMGLSLFKQAALQCNGNFKLTSELGKGTTVLAEFQLDSLNRSPLGDINSTMINLVMGTLDVHFMYIHRTDSGRFCFDSYWIFGRMAEHNISFYKAGELAKEFIEQNLEFVNSKG
ncbi:MAG: ATP-binding protein [Actinobacteria bacterium]|nr:ATP-binding protein [Actinomycetota bacterium]